MNTKTEGVVYYGSDDKELVIIVQPMFDEYNYLERERVWEILGDNDIIQIDEINPGVQSNYVLFGGEGVYFLTPRNWEELRVVGTTTLEYEGNVDDFIDETLHSHRDFKDWLGR
jgi:hypothetical protein